MNKELGGIGRMTIFRVLHDWSSGARCVIGYTTQDDGLVGVVGVIPVEGNTFEPGDLFAMAGRHDPSRLYGPYPEHARGSWLACLGSSARLVKAPDTIDVRDTEWSLSLSQRVTLRSPMYGHTHVVAGRMSLADEELEARARALIG